MTITDLSRDVKADIVAHQPWCAEHPTGPDRGPDACWTEPVDHRLYPANGRDADDDGESGHVTILMNHTDGKPRYGRTRTTSIFFDRFPDGDDGCAMDPDDAEITAFGLLALVAEARGDTTAADFYRSTVNDMAAVLLARRENGATS